MCNIASIQFFLVWAYIYMSSMHVCNMERISDICNNNQPHYRYGRADSEQLQTPIDVYTADSIVTDAYGLSSSKPRRLAQHPPQ